MPGEILKSIHDPEHRADWTWTRKDHTRHQSAQWLEVEFLWFMVLAILIVCISGEFEALMSNANVQHLFSNWESLQWSRLFLDIRKNQQMTSKSSRAGAHACRRNVGSGFWIKWCLYHRLSFSCYILSAVLQQFFSNSSEYWKNSAEWTLRSFHSSR